MLAYEKTQYPKIYKKTYWGCSSYDGATDDSIIKNRNTFVVDFKIKSTIDAPTESSSGIIGCGRDFDHKEFYKTVDNKFIMLSSPYSTAEKVKNNVHYKNFIQVYDLYTNCGSVSFIREFGSRKELKLFLKFGDDALQNTERVIMKHYKSFDALSFTDRSGFNYLEDMLGYGINSLWDITFTVEYDETEDGKMSDVKLAEVITYFKVVDTVTGDTDGYLVLHVKKSLFDTFDGYLPKDENFYRELPEVWGVDDIEW